MLPLTILSVTYLIPNVVVNCNVLCQSSPVLLSTFCFSVEDIHDIFVSSNRAKTSGAFSNPQSHNKRPQCHFRFTAFEIKSLRFDNFKIKILTNTPPSWTINALRDWYLALGSQAYMMRIWREDQTAVVKYRYF